MGIGRVAALILNILHGLAYLPSGQKLRHPLNTKLDGPQSMSELLGQGSFSPICIRTPAYSLVTTLITTSK